MSARRQARARAKVAMDATGGVPRCLAIGRLVEVWGVPELADPRSIRAASHARQRFGIARRWWLTTSQIEDRKGWKIIPAGAPWSIGYLTEQGKASAATERLDRAGCAVADLDDLRAEADALVAAAHLDDPREGLGA